MHGSRSLPVGWRPHLQRRTSRGIRTTMELCFSSHVASLTCNTNIAASPAVLLASDEQLAPYEYQQTCCLLILIPITAASPARGTAQAQLVHKQPRSSACVRRLRPGFSLSPMPRAHGSDPRVAV